MPKDFVSRPLRINGALLGRTGSVPTAGSVGARSVGVAADHFATSLVASAGHTGIFQVELGFK